jgi:hypothetical protein
VAKPAVVSRIIQTAQSPGRWLQPFMKQLIQIILFLTLLDVTQAQTFQRQTNESIDAFAKRIYKVEELSHKIIETTEWDSLKKVIICFVEFSSNDADGILGYLLTPIDNQTYRQTLIDTFFIGGGSNHISIEAVFFANADKDKQREIIVMTKANAHSPHSSDFDLVGSFYESYIYDNYNLMAPPSSLTLFKQLSEVFQEYDGVSYDSKTGKYLKREKAKYKNSNSIRIKLKQLGY